ncbi:hypothetical protein QR680_006273 [Steinernema hermaphroditum]|uniref:Uncharacterized protein n=1 Tax=Steinernema hermaphroditum TaxID=289476 RepID=A0AA39HW31_9BILA|nr:hypothetical protein QR680_006273 [Steinernema hermaphroditum]
MLHPLCCHWHHSLLPYHFKSVGASAFLLFSLTGCFRLQQSKSATMRDANCSRKCKRTDSLLRYPIQHRLHRLENVSDGDSSTTVEETSWSRFSVSSTGLSAKDDDSTPLTLTTLSRTPETTAVDSRSASSTGEKFDTLTVYDDFSTLVSSTSDPHKPKTRTSGTSTFTSTTTSHGSQTSTESASTVTVTTTTTQSDSVDVPSPVMMKPRVAAGQDCDRKRNLDFSFSDSSTESSGGSNKESGGSSGAQSVYYTDKITLCLKGKCKVFAFDRVNCRCNDSQWSREEDCSNSKEKKMQSEPSLSSCTSLSEDSTKHYVDTRPQVEPPILNEQHMWRYVGVLTHEEAEKAVRNRTDFRLYHQFVPGMDYSGVERLPLVVVYQSSKRLVYHWRVHSLGRFEEDAGKTMYKLEYYYVEQGGPTCRTLNDLLDIYADHAYSVDGQIENFFVYE